MIEYEFLEVWADEDGYVQARPLINGVRGPHKQLSACKACGVLVVDEVLHSKGHLTPVIG